MIKIQRSIEPKPKLDADERKVLKYYNSKYTISKIVEQTKKTKDSVEVALSRLRSKGMIKSVRVKGKLVYSKV